MIWSMKRAGLAAVLGGSLVGAVFVGWCARGQSASGHPDAVVAAAETGNSVVGGVPRPHFRLGTRASARPTYRLSAPERRLGEGESHFKNRSTSVRMFERFARHAKLDGDQETAVLAILADAQQVLDGQTEAAELDDEIARFTLSRLDAEEFHAAVVDQLRAVLTEEQVAAFNRYVPSAQVLLLYQPIE